MISSSVLSVGETSYQLEIWGDLKHKLSQLEYVASVRVRRIPLFLVSIGPFDVYSEHAETEGYFQENLTTRTGVMARSDAEVYVVFYLAGSGVKCFCIDFGIIREAQNLGRNQHSNIYFSENPRHAARSDTAVFDRVLEGRLSEKPTRTAPLPPPLLILSSEPQISETINKTILSGLRLRGLSRSSAQSAKQRVIIGEIYQMTKKAAHFALRKYNYDFNDANTKIKTSDIQDVVERLLEVFVDIEPAENFT